jgi:hypothetical protein
VPVRELARRLRVSPTAVCGWQQRWHVGGEQAPAPKWAGWCPVRLDEPGLCQLAEAMEAGPVAHGFRADQRWTSARGRQTAATAATQHCLPAIRPESRTPVTNGAMLDNTDPDGYADKRLDRRSEERHHEWQVA